MTADRIKEIQDKTAFPDSVSVCQALLQVWNECDQDMSDKKYTELQLRFFADELIKGIEEKNKQGYEDIKVDYESLILSLNKQD